MPPPEKNCAPPGPPPPKDWLKNTGIPPLSRRLARAPPCRRKEKDQDEDGQKRRATARVSSQVRRSQFESMSRPKCRNVASSVSELDTLHNTPCCASPCIGLDVLTRMPQASALLTGASPPSRYIPTEGGTMLRSPATCLHARGQQHSSSSRAPFTCRRRPSTQGRRSRAQATREAPTGGARAGACLRREGHEERGPDKAAAWRQHAAPRHTRQDTRNHGSFQVQRQKHLAQSRILDLSSIHRGFRHRRHAERALAGTGASGLHLAARQAT